MEIKFFTDQKEEWDNFVKTNALDGGFLQSWEWGEFQKSLGQKVFRVGAEDRGLVVAALLIKKALPFGRSYFYCPRGPILEFKRNVLDYLLGELKVLAKREGGMFLRVDSAWGGEKKEDFKKLGFKKSAWDLQPEQTLILDTTRSEEELLKQMKQKARYNIRLAGKKGVHIKQTVAEGPSDAFDGFWRLIKETAKRDGFRPHPKNYYKKLLEIPGVEIFYAEHDNKIIAANIVAFFGEWAYYLHGASDHQYRNLMAPYLLQWEAIKEAKNQGCKKYDFWGVALEKNHAWAGVTRFKQGFVPETPITKYVGTWDLPIKKGWYRIYKIIRKIRRWI